MRDCEIFAWWSIVEWVALCQPCLLNKGVYRAGLCFLYFMHAGILDWVMWARQVTDGTFAPMRFARAGGSSPPSQKRPRLHICMRLLLKCRLMAQLLGWTGLALTLSLASDIGGPHLAYHSSESSPKIYQIIKLFPTGTKNSQH